MFYFSVPVFKNHTMFVDEFWGWCNLTSTGVCPEVNVMDIAVSYGKLRNITDTLILF